VSEIDKYESQKIVSGSETTLKSETMTYMVFTDRIFDHVDFSRAEARLSRFTRCNFIDCAFEAADLQLSRFEDCVFSKDKRFEQRTGNLSSTYWYRCIFYEGQAWAWPHVSLWERDRTTISLNIPF